MYDTINHWPFVVIASLVLVGTFSLVKGEDMGQSEDESISLKNVRIPAVVLSYDGTGNFGTQTQSTKTAGWQEAINYCVAHNSDLYIKGGWGGRVPIYNVSETIIIPPSQDFKIEGGEYVLNWVGPKDKDLLVVDSSMDCHYTFGILVYGGERAALRIKPANPVPIDNMTIFIDSSIKTSSIADPYPFKSQMKGPVTRGGAGVIFDTSMASILHNIFHFTAVLNFETCIYSFNSQKEFAYNSVECPHLHTNADESILLRFGNKSFQNILNVRIGVDQGATGVKGIDMFGSYNRLEIITRGGFANGGDLIFEETAEANQVNILHMGDPLSIITDLASKPTNQITWTGGPLPIRTVEATTGTFVYTQRLCPAIIKIIGGKVSDIKLIRGSDTMNYETSHANDILMSVGDNLQIENTVAPNMKIIPIKVK